ncbi:MAG: hypothetical protein JRI56_00250 [Deltaproteobacteria bacterium]|nr:hypothetical protein [Deltaproteobacteria bacterium]
MVSPDDERIEEMDENLDAEDSVEETAEETEDKSEESKEDGILSKIASMLKPKKDEAEEDEEEEEENIEEEAGDEETDLVTDVLGWDKEVVAKLKELDPGLLDDVKNLLEKPADEETSEEDDAGEETSEAIDLDKIKALKEKDSEVGSLVESLAKQVEMLSSSLQAVVSEEQQRREQEERQTLIKNFRYANNKLDELAKDFPVLGSTSKLPKTDDGQYDVRNRAVRERARLWDTAVALQNAGLAETFEDAFEDAIALYKGRNAENLARRKISKELRERATKFTARPSHRKTKEKTPPKGSDEYKEAVIKKAMKAAGIDGG